MHVGEWDAMNSRFRFSEPSKYGASEALHGRRQVGASDERIDVPVVAVRLRAFHAHV
jgi:hypothetical protein